MFILGGPCVFLIIMLVICWNKVLSGFVVCILKHLGLNVLGWVWNVPVQSIWVQNVCTPTFSLLICKSVQLKYWTILILSYLGTVLSIETKNCASLWLTSYWNWLAPLIIIANYIYLSYLVPYMLQGLYSQKVLGLNVPYKCIEFKPKTWLSPFVYTNPCVSGQRSFCL